jgi:hypothetical protein
MMQFSEIPQDITRIIITKNNNKVETFRLNLRDATLKEVELVIRETLEHLNLEITPKNRLGKFEHGTSIYLRQDNSNWITNEPDPNAMKELSAKKGKSYSKTFKITVLGIDSMVLYDIIKEALTKHIEQLHSNWCSFLSKNK